MSEVSQLASAMLVMVFATVIVGCRAILYREQGKQVGKDSDGTRHANCFFSPLTILPPI
jgi:hypothetical protein